jgi:hypothetical protein
MLSSQRSVHNPRLLWIENGKFRIDDWITERLRWECHGAGREEMLKAGAKKGSQDDLLGFKRWHPEKSLTMEQHEKS